MKKLIALAVAAVMATGLFALDLGGIKGTWQDKKWDADWTFSADGKIVLSLTSTGEEIYTFKDGTVQNFKVNVDTTGVSISFDCKDTNRSYTFKKGVALNADLDMVVNPDWTASDYETVIKLKK
ncbi:hypothetical protein SAMN04487775_103239 [Treponema bryantii]|uniref:DUF5640 domain-containing protein n=1 Tax=Treponema bryantii TaxID=163 RepID=A0A1I3JUI3_9SPIR|nr:hypothetical protein [Treponema bryantii]SFI63615.1 hypothetical protein SAMN04487775_103239 [Treponema bryantii]